MAAVKTAQVGKKSRHGVRSSRKQDDENVPWPPRLPDLTTMDFFLWGFIKSKVYTRNYENLEDLNASITAAFQEIPSQMINSSVASFERRIRKVIEVRGRHVEN